MVKSTNEKAVFAAGIGALVGPTVRKYSHAGGRWLDKIVDPNSPLRSEVFERILLALSGAADVKIDDPILKTIIPTAVEMSAIAFWDGDEGVDREIERCRREAMHAISRSDNPEELAELFERRLQATKRVADFAKSFRPLMEASGGRFGAKTADKGTPDWATKIETAIGRLTDFLESTTHMDFDEQQRAALRTREEKLRRLRRAKAFESLSAGLDRRIAKERARRQKPGR
jgi:hypothetical protein